MKESKIQEKLISKLKEEFGSDMYIFKKDQSMFSKNGIPDVIGCISSKFFAIEVKTDTGITSELQLYELCKISTAKGLAFICRGERDIRRILHELHVSRHDTTTAPITHDRVLS